MSTRSRLPRATLEQKITILDYFHASGRPQLDTVEKFKDMVAISTLTFNEWVKRENEYRERYRQLDSKFEKSSRRKSSYKYEKINRAMDAMVQQKLGMNESVTEPMLREYWKMYAHQFGVENPKRLVSFSHGWLSQFKKRHGLLRKKGPKNADLTRVTNERLLAEPLQNIWRHWLFRERAGLISGQWGCRTEQREWETGPREHRAVVSVPSSTYA